MYNEYVVLAYILYIEPFVVEPLCKYAKIRCKNYQDVKKMQNKCIT